MTKLCVIGNSHISALVLGWKDIEGEFPDTQMEFFGAPGKNMDRLSISNGELVPRSAKLMRYFELTANKNNISAGYDGYLVCGLRLGLLHMEPLFGSYRFETLAHDERPLLSNQCFARALRGCVSDTVAVQTIRKLRAITSAPIVMIPEPLPASSYDECEFLNRAEQRGEEESIAGLFDTACSSVCEEFRARCCFQPASTKSSVLRTKEAYNMGSVQLRSGFTVAHKTARGIARHMNADYGAATLREILALSRFEAGQLRPTFHAVSPEAQKRNVAMKLFRLFQRFYRNRLLDKRRQRDSEGN